MYFIIYLITEDNQKLKYGLLDYIDISSIEFYDLKKKIVEIQNRFDEHRLRNPGHYELFISNENVN